MLFLRQQTLATGLKNGIIMALACAMSTQNAEVIAIATMIFIGAKADLTAVTTLAIGAKITGRGKNVQGCSGDGPARETVRPTAAMCTWTTTPWKNSGSPVTSTHHGFGVSKAAAGDPITAANHGCGKPAQCLIGDGLAMERAR